MSRTRFLLTPQARADLIAIWSYIAEESPEHADRVLERLHDTFVLLAETPRMGRQRRDLADARFRFWPVYSYVIAYLYESRPLQIIAIVHGARHLETFFQQRIGEQTDETVV